MKFYSISELRNQTKSVMKYLSVNKKVVIMDNGKPSALMMGINKENFELVLDMVQKLEVQLAVSELQEQSLKNFPISLTENEIQQEINATRKNREKINV